MAFGIMTRKWGILQRPLSNSLRSMKVVICCIARLHNFCIDERLKTTTVVVPSKNTLSLQQRLYMDSCAHAEHQQIMSYKYPQWSMAREELVKAIRLRELKRPKVNRRTKQKTTGEALPPASPSSQDAGQA